MGPPRRTCRRNGDGALAEQVIIVSGKIYVDPAQRESFLLKSLEAVAQARVSPGCLDFVVFADPLERGRVNVYEQWQSEADLEAFRGSGLEDDLGSMIVSAEVTRHHIASSGPA
jgi:quinol monooxygenase YgiN